MAVVMSMKERNMAWLEGDAASVRLETIFLQVSLSTAEVADAKEHTVLHGMSLTTTPQAFAARFVARIAPGVIDELFDVSDVAWAE